MADDMLSNDILTARCVFGPYEVRMPSMKRRLGFALQKRRKIAIEILSPNDSKVAWNPDKDPLRDDDQVIVRVLRLSRSSDKKLIFSDDISTDSQSTMDDDDIDETGKTWRETHRFLSHEMEIRHVLNHGHMAVQFGAGKRGNLKVRQVKFSNPEEAKRFQHVWERIRAAEKQRAKRQAQKYKAMSGKKKNTTTSSNLQTMPLDASETILEDDDEDISLLVEIVSGTDFPVADITSSDPYVVCNMLGKEVHRTGVLKNTLNPIWTLETGSLFHLRMSPEEFFSSRSGMTLIVKDFDQFGKNDILGMVTVPLEDILKGKGERVGYDLQLPPESKNQKGAKDKKKKQIKGTLFLRFKKATPEDIGFLEAIGGNAKKFGVHSEETFVPIRMQSAKFLKRQVKHQGKDKVHRVRPCPDPDRPEDATMWMTKEAIKKEALKPSTKWISAGSGDLGKLYIEVIGCDKLPNMDVATLNIRDKTDAFANIVFEDCVINTDVIGDSLSPRWMPWSQRAFVLSVSHPSSNLLMGIFDYDPELSPLQLLSTATSDLHDPIGRIVIELSKFAPDTTYLLTYPLYFGELAEHREKARGTVTIRLRLEFPDIRATMLRGLSSSPPVTVCVSRKIDFDVGHYTVEGAIDDDKFSLNMLTQHVVELYTYDVIVDYITSAFLFIWIWRCHYPVSLFGMKFKAPLHSITAYIWGLMVTWNYDLFPSFCVFCIAWTMLATNEQMQKHKLRWRQCPSYYDLLQRLIFGVASREDIPEYHDKDEVVKYMGRLAQFEDQRKDHKKREETHEELLQKDLGEDLEAAEKAEQVGKSDDDGLLSFMNPLKPILYPLQQQLRSLVIQFRVIKSVLLWNESYKAFWITTGSLALSVALCWIPWCFVTKWFLRIAIFVGLGPWMMLVDKYYFKTKFDEDMSFDEKEKAFQKRLKARYEQVLAESAAYQIRRERAIKMKSMKRYMFGKFHLRVPMFHEDFFFDYPDHSSSAVPFQKDAAPAIHVVETKFGQNLVGDMVPKREIEVASAKNMSELRKKKKKSRTVDGGHSSKGPERNPVPMRGGKRKNE